jgi:putative colanic acid biosynthesis acetyltransferase WcaB
MGIGVDIKYDLQANTGNRKGMFIVVSYRVSSFLFNHKYRMVRLFSFPLCKFYRIVFKWIMGIEIPEQTKIGKGLVVWHGQGLVINHKAIIGENVILRHCTTIGNKYKGSGCPRIGNNVEIGCNSVLIGDIEIGDNVVIGAGSVVTKSIPSDSIAFGNPIVINRKNSISN